MKRKIIILVCSAAAILATAAITTRATPVRPNFKEYRGVSIGMSADEARKKLGTPKDTSNVQEYFVFSDSESVQLYYDEQLRVRAISIMFMGDISSAPQPLAVFGNETEVKQDGSIYRIERYPDAGYFVSYTKTTGDVPMVVIAMQKI